MGSDSERQRKEVTRPGRVSPCDQPTEVSKTWATSRDSNVSCWFICLRGVWLLAWWLRNCGMVLDVNVTKGFGEVTCGCAWVKVPGQLKLEGYGFCIWLGLYCHVYVTNKFNTCTYLYVHDIVGDWNLGHFNMFLSRILLCSRFLKLFFILSGFFPI